jgi:hypothetical protein
MAPLWGSVRSALADFALAVPDRSELDVRFFAGSVEQPVAPTPASPSVRQSWATTLANLAAPDGGQTDLGRAAEAALRKVSAQPTDRLQFVFFLTDGRQQAGDGSPYPAQWGRGWPELARQARQLIGARPVRVGIVRLARDADVSLLQRVFPDAVVTDAIGPDALRAWFDTQTREGAVGRLLLLLDDDLRRPAATLTAAGSLRTFAGRGAAHEVVLQPGRRVLTTVLPAGTALSLPGGGSAALEGSVRLVSGAGPVRARAIVRDRGYPFFFPPGIFGRSAEGAVPVRSTLEPAAELARIGVSPGPAGSDTVRVSLVLRGGGAAPGWVFWPLSLLAAVVAGGGLLRFYWSLHRPVLPGRIVNLRHREGDPAAGEVAVVDFRGRKLRTYTVQHPGGRASVVLDAVNRRGKTVVTARSADPSVRVRADRRPLVGSMTVSKVMLFESDLGEFRYDPH